MKEEKNTIPFYKRKEFSYLSIACAALMVAAIGAGFYNNHPRSEKKRKQVSVQNDHLLLIDEAALKSDSLNYQQPDTQLNPAGSNTLQ